MKWLLGFLMLTVVLAIVKLVLLGIAVAAGVALLFAFVRRPRSTAVFMVVLTLSGLATARPLAAIVTIGLVSVAFILTSSRRRHEQRCLSGAELEL